VVEFETLARPAACSIRPHEGALPLIPLPDRAPDRRRDVAASDSGTLRARAARTLGGAELPLLLLHDQGIERPVEHLSDVPRGHGMAQQRLDIAELVVRAPWDRDLDEIALLGLGRWLGFNSSWDELVVIRAGRAGRVGHNSSWDEFAIHGGGAINRNSSWGKLRNDGPDHGSRLRQREPPREPHLDLELPPVCRRLDQLLDVLRREMGSQQADRRQIQPPISDRRKEHRKLPGRPSRPDPPKGRVLGQAQLLDTVRVHGRVSRRGVQPADVHLRNMSEERRRREAIASDQRRQIAKESFVTEMGQRVVVHESNPHGACLGDCLGGGQARWG
jgi:hypothetical protein